MYFFLTCVAHETQLVQHMSCKPAIKVNGNNSWTFAFGHMLQIIGLKTHNDFIWVMSLYCVFTKSYIWKFVRYNLQNICECFTVVKAVHLQYNVVLFSFMTLNNVVSWHLRCDYLISWFMIYSHKYSRLLKDDQSCSCYIWWADYGP